MKRKMNKGQKVGYWTIITNIVLVLTTFWLGLTVQDIVADRNAKVSAVLAKVEWINNVKPEVDSLNIKYNSFIRATDSTLSYWENKPQLTLLGSEVFFITNAKKISEYYGDLINTSKKVMYYLDDNFYFNESGLGVLYSYKELFDFYFEDDTVSPAKAKSIKDWPQLDRRLSSLYESPDYVCAMGLTIHYNQNKDIFKQKYESLFKSDGVTPNIESLAKLYCESFNLALDIHKTLNDNRVYRQQEVSAIQRFIKAPWSILFVCIIVIWIIFTIIVYRTADEDKSTENENSYSDLKVKLSNVQRETNIQLESIKSQLRDKESQLERVKAGLSGFKSEIDTKIEKIENDLDKVRHKNK